jgi:hypothetical protein
MKYKKGDVIEIGGKWFKCTDTSIATKVVAVEGCDSNGCSHPRNKKEKLIPVHANSENKLHTANLTKRNRKEIKEVKDLFDSYSRAIK